MKPSFAKGFIVGAPVSLALWALLLFAPALAQKAGNSNGFSTIVQPDGTENGVEVQVLPPSPCKRRPTAPLPASP